MHLTSLITTALAAAGTLAKSNKDTSAVLLSKVRSLTLRDGYETSHRRVSAMPQLNCVGGNAKGLYDVEEMRCKNSGSQYDAEDVQWTCQASLPPEFKLGSTEVMCEGYDSPDDPYILKGSCGVEYRLILTPLGESKYGPRSESAWKSRSNSLGEGGLSDKVATTLFWVVFVGILCVIVYSVCCSGTGTNRNRLGRGFNPGFGGGGGGYGDDDSSDPPPPYTPRAPKTKKSSTRSSAGTASSSSQVPSFLGGAATGAAAGYAAGAWNAARQNRNRSYQDPPRAGPSSWFQRQEPTYNAPSNWGAGPSTSSPSPSSSRHESTGFGGTTRR
ncbi:uncharacterized protein RCC_07671 [Ramularia collo-cygni]|uniref:Store-operated calcium entry-associated regulatory factor n=1 Tax=Ramularia collo-cygni TaxID=112498 RepID=A0A2D3V536_9PEZI|nr:uncharacterized protein RCC_07671 [Ramularia collo-cygni]CZT21805.1 uncharacterized protein RCC_07671 [Ramularia collo-cygni]